MVCYLGWSLFIMHGKLCVCMGWGVWGMLGSFPANPE